MRPYFFLRLAAFAAFAIAALVISACGSDDDKSKTATKGDSQKLVVYSGRSTELVDALYKKFEAESGIDLDVRYGDSPELSATLAEEGENSRADVFYSQDAGAVGTLGEDLLAKLPQATLDKVDAKYRDNNGLWVGVTGRVRTMIYNTDKLQHGELPDSIFELTKPMWKGRLGIAPGNASFQAFVSAMRLSIGGDRTLEWLKAMKKNDVKLYEKNGPIVEATAKGEIDGGLVNHYYLYEIKAEQADAPIANHFFADGDPGTFVNVSAVGILKGAKNRAAADKFIAFLQGEGQKYFAEEAEEKEYPLVADSGAVPAEGLKPLDQIKGPDVDLTQLGDELKKSVELIDAAGFSSN